MVPLSLTTCGDTTVSNQKQAKGEPSRPTTKSSDHLSAITRISEAELLTRFAVSRTTVYRLRKAGLPCIRVGRRVLYNPADVGAWLETLGQEAA
jgi:excisionase family DNA binding protein